MFTLVQEGLTPLAMGHMWNLESTVEAFLSDTPEVIRFDDLTAELLSEDADWSDLPRRPTPLEIMAACCALERRRSLQFHFINGLMHVALS